MSEAPLLALQRHFEEQYGKLNLPGLRGKKRKRGHVRPEPELPKEQATNSEEEWQGINGDASDDDTDDPPSVAGPEVVSFTETAEITEDAEVVSYKSFMVESLLSNADLVIEVAQSCIGNEKASDRTLRIS
jgi:hypothetical protein